MLVNPNCENNTNETNLTQKFCITIFSRKLFYMWQLSQNHFVYNLREFYKKKKEANLDLETRNTKKTDKKGRN